MEKKYKNAKTSYEKLSDDKKIDFLLSRIDKVTSHADNLVNDINQKVSKKKPITLKEKLQKGYINISFSHKRLWDERVLIDKIFSGQNPPFNKELSSLYSMKLLIKQTKKAPNVIKYTDGSIDIDFPKGIKKSSLLMQRMFIDVFIKDYFEYLTDKIDYLFNEDTFEKFSILFIKKSNIMMVSFDTKKYKILEVLKKILGLENVNIFFSSNVSIWEECFYRIMQIGAVSRIKDNPTELEIAAGKTLTDFEGRLIKKLERRL